MDYEARISKVEAQLEMQQKDIDRLYQAIDELRKLMLDRFDRTDRSIAELRKYIDLKISELRTYTDLNLGELRTHTDLSLSELRAHTERGLSELRAHTDRSIGELRAHTDHRFNQMQNQIDELRKEVGVNLRWMIGMWLTTMGMIAGIGGRVFGMY